MKKNKIMKDTVIWNSFLIALIFFATLSVGIVAYKTICSNVLNSYSDYSSYEISYRKMLKQSDDDYYIYIYQTDCSACNSVKATIFDYMEYSESNELKYTLYLLNADDLGSDLGTDESITLIGISDYKEIKITGTPTMLYIKDGVVAGVYENTTEIINQLKV